MRRKRSRTLDQALARIDAILDRLLVLAADTEEMNRLVREKLSRMEGTTVH